MTDTLAALDREQQLLDRRKWLALKAESERLDREESAAKLAQQRAVVEARRRLPEVGKQIDRVRHLGAKGDLAALEAEAFRLRRLVYPQQTEFLERCRALDDIEKTIGEAKS